VRQVP